MPTSPTPEKPILAEAQSDSLNDLFARDPLQLQDSDIDRIVAELRAQRERWNMAESRGAKRAPKTPAPGGLDLSDLGLSGGSKL